MKKHTEERTSPKKPSASNRYRAAAAKLCAGLAVSAALLNQASADTPKQGNIYNETWTITGSPYRLIDNCTVVRGYKLTIEPGVMVKIDEGYSLNVYGQLFAEGSCSGRITFTNTRAGKYWNQILIQNPDGGVSPLTYCDLTGATNALSLQQVNNAASWTPQIANCTFSNCVAYCVIAWNANGYLNVRISNSRFSASANGFYMYASGIGGSSILIANNIFEGIPGKAVWFNPQPSVATITPSLVNNLFKQCGVAVDMKDNFDCALYNNIIQDSPVAIRTSGALSRNVYYNCLFNNQTNFIGYPSAYGRIDDVNANGTPADAFMNITNNPLFCEVTNYTLSATSPCIDAGNPAGAYLDNCFAASACQPGSLGTSVNDIGIWGGPYACGWCTNRGTSFCLSARTYVGVTIYPSTPGRYRLDWTAKLCGSTNFPPTGCSNTECTVWTQLTNVVLQSTPWTYIDFDSPGVGKRFYRGVLLP